MTTERTTERADGRERIVERDSSGTIYVKPGGGSGLGGVILGLAVLALVAIVAFFLLNQSRNDDLRTSAATSAAASVADSASGAARNVGDAARNVGDAAQNAGAAAQRAADSAGR
jgi:hypothetical protein